MPGPTHFDEHAAAYVDARPPYPPELWDRVRATGLVGPARRAVDLGAGTGEATGPLLAAGCDVVAVEPGPRLAALLRSRHPAADVVVARAEDLDLADSSFDVAVAATSIHWLRLDRLLPALHRALAPHGRFLVWRNVFGDPSAPPTPFRERVGQIVARRHEQARRGAPDDVRATAASLSASGLFSVDEVSEFRWDVQLDIRQVHALFGTFSDWSPAEVDEVATAVSGLGGRVTEHYTSWLIVSSPRRS